MRVAFAITGWLLTFLMFILLVGVCIHIGALKHGDLNLDGKVDLLDVSIMADNLDKM